MRASVQEVMEDTYLSEFLLNKEAVLQMPSRVIHQDQDFFGDTEFLPRRFQAEERAKKPREACFHAFGGGKTFCPGRQLQLLPWLLIRSSSHDST